MDGRFGRNINPSSIQQPRRRAPGWDACRDRLDGNLDDRGPKYNLMWSQPAQRSMHRGIWSQKHRLFLIFGGTGNTSIQINEKKNIYFFDIFLIFF